MRTIYSVLMLVLVSPACNPKPGTPPAMNADRPGIVNRDWTLARLGDNAHPLGNGGRPVTLRLDTTEKRAWGNAGCNRFSSPYHLAGDSLVFGPAISTKMACAQGMEVEIAFLSMLNEVRTYQATDSSLTLMGPAGKLARFR
jgi:heat shock protein HslJ